MTNKDKLFELMQIFTGEDSELIREVFEIVNRKDWTYFCSEMGDYDHPEERSQADKVFTEEIDKLVSKMMDSHTSKEWENFYRENNLNRVMKIVDLFNNCNFYSKTFTN